MPSRRVDPHPIAKQLLPFTLRVIGILRKIPKGKVATYGQIAALSGKPHGARGVGWILNACSETHKLPWQRVINSKGSISFPKKSDEYAEQQRLLKKEGVRISTEGKIDLEKYQWQKWPREGGSRGPKMFR